MGDIVRSTPFHSSLASAFLASILLSGVFARWLVLSPAGHFDHLLLELGFGALSMQVGLVFAAAVMGPRSGLAAAAASERRAARIALATGHGASAAMTIGAAIAAGTILAAQKAFENTDLLIDIRDYLVSIAIFAISLSAIFYLIVGERSGSFLAAIGLLFASLWTLMFLIIISSTTIIGSAALSRLLAFGFEVCLYDFGPQHLFCEMDLVNFPETSGICYFLSTYFIL